MGARRRVPSEQDYAISKETPTRTLAAPRLPYRPARPRAYRPRIGVIGCGGIISTHLKAYRDARYQVVALADPMIERAEKARDAFYPRARVYASAEALLAESSIDVVDIATHPEERVELLLAAIRAGKHILSQKPFVTDLAVGRRIVAAARRKGVKLAVNQNGRWAAHVSYARQAIAAGLLGDVTSVDLQVCWDHNWVAGTPFEAIHHLLLYDFGIHWFDMTHCYLGPQRATSVFAAVCRTRSQRAQPPLSAHAVMEYPHAEASILLRGDTRYGPEDRTVIVGTRGTLISRGPNINEQTVTLYTARGKMVPRLTTRWFPDGFDGTMSELLCAIEDDREPSNSARDNLASLAMCFAALESADRQQPVKL
ncbi:MAG: Gfo/Idh/MocA family oxidoreductase [Pirellulaceae bacterium]|jgi:predicted dehydrogenase|nr:Gfo/Idh/MocA family oxidoreductase [Pirellulaceae bacterium]